MRINMYRLWRSLFELKLTVVDTENTNNPYWKKVLCE